MYRSDLEKLSTRVWEFLRDAPFQPREETITEGLLTAMHRRHHATSFVAKSTVDQEVKEGHDWLWALRSPSGHRWLHLRVQAKSLFDSGLYEGLGTSAKGNKKAKQQAEALLRAKKVGQVPVYAFFNREAGPFGGAGKTGIRLGCGRSPFTRGAPAQRVPSLAPLGVTLVDADWVRWHIERKPELLPPRWSISAPDINPAAIPWECLTCAPISNSCMTLPGRFILGQAREAFFDDNSTDVLGVSDRPQPWAESLERDQPAAAWDALRTQLTASGLEPVEEDEPVAPRGPGEDEDDADAGAGTLPDYILVTHLSEGDAQ